MSDVICGKCEAIKRNIGPDGACSYCGLKRDRDDLRTENVRLREALAECRAGVVAEYGWRVWEVNFPKAANLDEELMRPPARE